MAAPAFVELLNTQIGNEYAAHQQYVACAVYFDELTMPRTARCNSVPGAAGSRDT